MGECAKNNISLSFLSYSGKFLAGIHGTVKGNVILRKEQYRISEDIRRSTNVAKNFITGKIFNSKWIIERAIRDYPLRLDVEKLKKKSQFLSNSLKMIRNINGLEELRGIEGEAASVYFSVFDDLILQQKDAFIFKNRNKRPPLDYVNAMLSFSYSLLASMCASALETVGLDPYVGFLHRDRPGRISLALDLMEELRAVYADRFVLTMINKKIINESDFIKRENESVIMTDEGRKEFLKQWQNKKQEVIKHPFLDEKVEWGMIPYVQALLLARYIRNDLDEYPPFLWK
jgi:CRISPR-associated protein Cas1